MPRRADRASPDTASPHRDDGVLGRFTKWRGAHWEWLGRYLDEDEFGWWLTALAGTRCSRPGVSFLEPDPWVSLVPSEGHLFVDDEDEFEHHQDLLGYPPEVVSLAERTAREVLDAVAAGEEPFATVGFERLRQVTSEP